MEDYERCLIGTLYVSKFYKSWLIFYKLGLCNTDVRNKLKYEYFCPWNSADGENWNYLSIYGNCQAGDCSSIEESERELFSMFDYWKKATLLADEFEVFDTLSMGLGVRVTEQASQSAVFFRPLSLHALHGFLEVIPESLFDQLRTIGHQSLYKTYDRSSRKWVFSILFGPLSLVNSKPDNSIGFSGLDTQLRTLIWRVTYSFGMLTSGRMDSVHVVDKLLCEYFDEDLEDVITSELKPKRLKYGAVVPAHLGPSSS